MFTVSQAARAAGISPSSVRGWSKLLAAVLSDSANPAPDIARRFTADDVVRLHTARVMRGDGIDWSEVIAAIEAGRLILPADMPREAGSAPAGKERTEDQHSTALVTRLTATVARFEGELSATKEALDHARAQLAAEHEARINAERQAAQLAGRLEAMREVQPAANTPQETPTAGRDTDIAQPAENAVQTPLEAVETTARPSWRKRFGRWVAGS